MYTSAGLSALLFVVHVSAGKYFPAHNFATVTLPAHLWPRQDGAITDLGPGCSKSTIAIPSSNSTVVLPAICLASFPSYTPSSVPTSAATPSSSQAATSPAATVTCVIQEDDPDSGIEQQGCICTQGTTTKTLPLLATGVLPSSSCGYTALGTNTLAITTNWGTPVTNTQICQACTPTTDFGATCTSLANCFPETPSATLQIGSSPVQVGTLTSAALYTSISSAIASLCPTTATACDEKTKVTIPNIAYVEADSLETDGELIVQIDSSGYNDSSTLKTLIGMAAQSFAYSATGSNCGNVTYTVEELRKRDHPYPVEEQINLCQAGHFASPQYYSQYWREAAKPGPQDYLSVEITFGTGPGGAILCDFIKDLLEFMEIAFTPELLGPEQEADEEFGKSTSL